MKRFLNVVYEGNKAEINITGMERLSEVQEKVKSFFGHNIPGAASQIQLWDQEGNQIKIWKDFNVLNDEYFEEEGLELVIQLLPSPELVPIASSRPVLNTKVTQIDGIDINTEHLKRAAGVDIYNPFGSIASIGQLHLNILKGAFYLKLIKQGGVCTTEAYNNWKSLTKYGKKEFIVKYPRSEDREYLMDNPKESYKSGIYFHIVSNGKVESDKDSVVYVGQTSGDLVARQQDHFSKIRSKHKGKKREMYFDVFKAEIVRVWCIPCSKAVALYLEMWFLGQFSFAANKQHGDSSKDPLNLTALFGILAEETNQGTNAADIERSNRYSKERKYFNHYYRSAETH